MDRPKTSKGVFVGYSDTSKAYRFWAPSEGKIKVSRDVVFYDKFEKRDEYEDIVYEEMTNGRFKPLENREDVPAARKTVSGQSCLNPEKIPVQEHV